MCTTRPFEEIQTQPCPTTSSNGAPDELHTMAFHLAVRAGATLHATPLFLPVRAPFRSHRVSCPTVSRRFEKRPRAAIASTLRLTTAVSEASSVESEGARQDNAGARSVHLKTSLQLFIIFRRRIFARLCGTAHDRTRQPSPRRWPRATPRRSRRSARQSQQARVEVQLRREVLRHHIEE